MTGFDTNYPGALRHVRPINDTAAIALIVEKAGKRKGKYPNIQLKLDHTATPETPTAPIPTLQAIPVLNSITHTTTDWVSIYFQSNCALSARVNP